ncbi:hypothetical protein NDU88_005025 [Pleurodeles waltl]|uniref:Uncharacterized protein n=1 Tax=Pleurodeles waltl TaxID=8319 RepID=A0AAV7VKF9_PLEWA|nr:hypothetical protein NDU88_005025 [Pleurodeles waltl]
MVAERCPHGLALEDLQGEERVLTGGGTTLHLNNMATQRPGKREGNFARTTAKNIRAHRGAAADGGGTSSCELGEEDTTPITKSFMEQLFGVLQEDLATLRQDLVTTIQELKSEVEELGHGVTGSGGNKGVSGIDVLALDRPLDKDITPTGKVPGQDGLGVEFYQLFGNLLAPLLARLFKGFASTGSLAPSMEMGTITVIPKPIKDSALCSPYWPITLLNVDAKLFTAILEHRLGPYIQG